MHTATRLGLITLCIGGISLGYDLPTLINLVPPTLWPLIAVCSLYPSLLGRWLISNRTHLDWLDAAGIIGSCIYPTLAIPYYLLGITQDFAWFNLLWVLAYGSIGWWSWNRVPAYGANLLPGAALVAASLLTQRLTGSFGYLRADLLTGTYGNIALGTGLALTAALMIRPYLRTMVR
jgi:hypothetical protein